jgi:predicted nucleotidyltransferase
MATSAADVRACASGLLARIRREVEERERRAVILRARVREAAACLVERYAAKRVWLFGSLAWGEIDEHSDVDLLVEGLGDDRWDAASALLEERIGVPVDLVRVEEADASLVERVKHDGLLLHERA